jgi:hypothetical protein
VTLFDKKITTQKIMGKRGRLKKEEVRVKIIYKVQLETPSGLIVEC